MTIKFEYKCRRCAAIHAGPSMGGQSDRQKANQMLLSATPDFNFAHSKSKTVSAMSLHACADGGTGIADLIGYVMEEV